VYLAEPSIVNFSAMQYLWIASNDPFKAFGIHDFVGGSGASVDKGKNFQCCRAEDTFILISLRL
jgi:hypothetical protein